MVSVPGSVTRLPRGTQITEGCGLCCPEGGAVTAIMPLMSSPTGQGRAGDECGDSDWREARASANKSRGKSGRRAGSHLNGEIQKTKGTWPKPVSLSTGTFPVSTSVRRPACQRAPQVQAGRQTVSSKEPRSPPSGKQALSFGLRSEPLRN